MIMSEVMGFKIKFKKNSYFAHFEQFFVILPNLAPTVRFSTKAVC